MKLLLTVYIGSYMVLGGLVAFMWMKANHMEQNGKFHSAIKICDTCAIKPKDIKPPKLVEPLQPVSR